MPRRARRPIIRFHSSLRRRPFRTEDSARVRPRPARPIETSPSDRVTVRGVPVLLLLLWTWELLAENPVPESVSRAIPNEWKVWLAKSLHVGAYAFLTVLAGLLPVGRKYFWGAIVLLLLHGIGSEIGQTFVDGRHGSIRDVGLDWVGVVLGLLVLQLGKWMFGRGGERGSAVNGPGTARRTDELLNQKSIFAQVPVRRGTRGSPAFGTGR